MMTEKQKQNETHRAQNLVIGGGVAGIVVALELLDAGQSVILVDADTEERFGGLARWAFGGMALAGTPEQKRLGIKDSPQRLLEDWKRFGEMCDSETWPLAWAECYSYQCVTEIHDWLQRQGLKFMPAVNLAERGEFIEGNSVPRYHILWGTGLGLVENLIEKLRRHRYRSKLTLLHQHRVVALSTAEGQISGGEAVSKDGRRVVLHAGQTIVSSGGINGTIDNVRKHWLAGSPGPPETILNGACPLSNGDLHAVVAEHGGVLTRLGDMWNYAAGIPHPQPHFPGHGLSLIPCKTTLWLDPNGEPMGPAPMISGFDTNQLCQQVAEHEYTWQVLNYRIAARELAISGSQHNSRIVRKQFLRFVWDTLTANPALIDQMLRESSEFITADSVPELTEKMNRLVEQDEAGSGHISGERLQTQIDEFDAAMADPAQHETHPIISRIQTIREWRTDKLRTCNMQPIGDEKAGPLLAIRLRYISRKSLGGIQTDLQSRVLDASGTPIQGLYAVGEAAGFGGGGISGKRSLEGTFLSSCILTARKAAAAITGE